MWGVVRATAGVAAAVVVAGAGLMGASAATGSGNLLPNGSFDNGSSSGWRATNAKLSLATPGYGGSSGALKVAWNGSGSAYTVWASPLPAGCDMRTILGPRTTTIQPTAHIRTPGDLFTYAAAAGITLPPKIKTAC